MFDPAPPPPITFWTFEDFGVVADTETNPPVPPVSNQIAQANLIKLNEAIAWSAVKRVPIYGLKNSYTIRASGTDDRIKLLADASVVCLDGCIIGWRHDSGAAGVVGCATASPNARWTGGTFLGRLGSGGSPPTGDVFSLFGDNILLTDIAIAAAWTGTAILIRGNGNRIIAPRIDNMSNAAAHGIRVTGGTGFRCQDGFVKVGGDALLFSPDSNLAAISDGCFRGTRAESTSKSVLVIESEYAGISNARFEAITGTRGSAGNCIRINNKYRFGRTEEPIADLIFRDIDMICGNSTEDAVSISNGLPTSPGTDGQLTGIAFRGMILRGPAGTGFRVTASGDVRDVSWIGGAITPRSNGYTGKCIVLDRLDRGIFSTLRLAAGTSDGAVSVGETVACANIAFADNWLSGVQSGLAGVKFNLTTFCGWSRGAIAGTGTAIPVAFTANVVGGYIEDSNLNGIGIEPKIAIATGANYRLTGNFGSTQRTPVGLGMQTSVLLSAGIITITSSAVRVSVPTGETPTLTVIMGGVPGDLLVLTKSEAAATLTISDSGMNLRLAGPCVLNTPDDSLTLLRDTANWIEIARSDNS